MPAQAYTKVSNRGEGPQGEKTMGKNGTLAQKAKAHMSREAALWLDEWDYRLSQWTMECGLLKQAQALNEINRLTAEAYRGCTR